MPRVGDILDGPSAIGARDRSGGARSQAIVSLTSGENQTVCNPAHQRGYLEC